MDLHGHLVEAAGTLVDDTEEVIAAVTSHGWRSAQNGVVVAYGVLQLVDLDDLGLQFFLQLLQPMCLSSKLLVSLSKCSFEISNPQSKEKAQLSLL